MNNPFYRLDQFVDKYKPLINNDPFMDLKLSPLSKDLPTDSKYSSFFKDHRSSYIEDIKNCFWDYFDVYPDIEKVKDKKKKTGFEINLKISDPKVEIGSEKLNIAYSDRLKAAEFFEAAVEYFKNNKYEESKKALEQTLKFDPDNPFVINNLFIVNYLLANFEELKNVIEKMRILGFKKLDFFV